jgi:zinc transport system permease protein
MTILSLIFGVFSTIIGLCLSFILDFPSGASIIILQSVVFGISIVFSKFKRD